MRARAAVASFLGGLALGALPIPALLWHEHRVRVRTATGALCAAVSTAARPSGGYVPRSYDEGGTVPAVLSPGCGMRLPDPMPDYSPFHDYPLRRLNYGG